jgi:hypothetical protein
MGDPVSSDRVWQADQEITIGSRFALTERCLYITK